MLGALGLVVTPLVGRFGLFDGRIVFVQTRIGLGGPAHVAKDSAHGGNDSGEQRNLCRHAVALLGMGITKFGVLQLVIVGAVNVKT